MAENSPQRKITDLLPELALRICEFLDAPDLVSLCMSIPSWRWILSTWPFSNHICQHINKYTWLDKRLCQLLFPQPSPTSFRNAPEAIRYQKEQVDTYQRFASTPAQGKAPRTAHFRILPDFDVNIMSEDEFTLRMEALRDPFTNYITIVKYRQRMRIVGMHGCIFTSCSTKEGERGGHNCCDCIIYLVDPLRFLRDDLTATLESLAPHKVLIIAVIINTRRDMSTEMDCLAEFLQSFGDFNSSPLASVPANWRLWCIKRHQGSFINWSNLLEWGFYDVICKKIQSEWDGNAISAIR
ncbi:expressed conserved protein [Echinococcus multilocularis]|uniref:Expressed conserved protein n=1 Tax=Echinococcus multilocularis TaxID=6211 RepID=A0A087W022_ECHMU|nr:expressed conserved protein [Echinococcus multilocularis]